MAKFQATDKARYTTAKARVLRRMYTERGHIIDANSYLAELSHHIVSLKDFQATVFSLARIERLESFIPAGETQVERDARMARRSLAKTAKDEHVRRLNASRATTVQKAEEELNCLEVLDDGEPSREGVRKARREYEFYSRQNVPWAPRNLDTYKRANSYLPLSRMLDALDGSCRRVGMTSFMCAGCR